MRRRLDGRPLADWGRTRSRVPRPRYSREEPTSCYRAGGVALGATRTAGHSARCGRDEPRSRRPRAHTAAPTCRARSRRSVPASGSWRHSPRRPGQQRLLLLDEPAAHLDISTSCSCFPYPSTISRAAVSRARRLHDLQRSAALADHARPDGGRSPSRALPPRVLQRRMRSGLSCLHRATRRPPSPSGYTFEEIGTSVYRRAIHRAVPPRTWR